MRRLKYLVSEDISAGKEVNEIPAWSYKRHDQAPGDFRYVTEYVECPVSHSREFPHDQVRVSLFRTKSRGWGVRADEPIEPGTFIGVYSGELITARDSTFRQDDTYLFNLSDSATLQVDESSDQYVCDAKFYGNFTRFINHSCEPNLVGTRDFSECPDDRFPYIAFYTNQKIAKHSELTLNYGDNYWLVKSKRDEIYCLCKQSSCKFRKPARLSFCAA